LRSRAPSRRNRPTERPAPALLTMSSGEMFRLARTFRHRARAFSGRGRRSRPQPEGPHPHGVVNASASPFAKNGKMRALAVSTPERAAVLPDVPTVREAGYPEVESTNWSGLVVRPQRHRPRSRASTPSWCGRCATRRIQEKLKTYGMFPCPGHAGTVRCAPAVRNRRGTRKFVDKRESRPIEPVGR